MRFFRKKQPTKYVDSDSGQAKPATLASIGKKLENYQATQGRATFTGQSDTGSSTYGVEEISANLPPNPAEKAPRT